MATFRWPSGWDPLVGIRAMQKELERLSGRSAMSGSRQIGGGTYPPVNVLNGQTELVVECEIAGLKREDVDLTITGETLQIKGAKSPLTSDEVRYQCRERGMGDFNRTIVLPDRVDTDRISASLANGILTVRLPKAEASLPKHIEVK